jgi:hypothetical protein
MYSAYLVAAKRSDPMLTILMAEQHKHKRGEKTKEEIVGADHQRN